MTPGEIGAEKCLPKVVEKGMITGNNGSMFDKLNHSESPETYMAKIE